MSPAIHDLSLPITHGMSSYPAAYHARVEVNQIGRLEEHGRESRRLVLGTHSGTHIDGASHFIARGRTIDLVPLDDLIGPARLITFAECAPRSMIGADAIHQRLGGERPERLIIRYDWSRHWGRPEFYVDHPFLAADACDFLVSLGLRLLGYDCPSPDDPQQSGPGHDPDSPNHKALLGSGVTLIEYLANLDQIQGDRFQIVALPLRIIGGDASPARVIAIEA